jgi:urea carboxylase
MLTVLKPGLETTVQDWPGLKGAFRYGFNASGPVDHWSFRLANLLVSNAAGAPGLEAQFIGPTLKFETDGWFAIAGADMRPKLDGEPVTMWQTTTAKAGQTLSLGPALSGARTYIAFAGGIAAKPFLGSCATHPMAAAGGLDGRKLAADDAIPLNPADTPAPLSAPEAIRPVISSTGRWDIEVVVGPSDDWISDAGHKLFFATDWGVSAKANRMGIRLDGPELLFAERALNKAPEHGSHPSNCVDIGYPFGGINLCGDTPVILLNEGLTLGGFIVPYTVPTAAFPKLGQARPNEVFRFHPISVADAQAMRRQISEICQPHSLVPTGA